AEDLLDQRFIIRDEAPFQPSLDGMAEGIEGGAAKESQTSQKAEGLHNPWAIALLDRTAVRIPRLEQRRREVEPELDVAPQLAADRRPEMSVCIEPCHLILVLVGEELEVVPRDRLGEAAEPRRALRLGMDDAIDQTAVALGVGCVLVAGQELDPLG